MRPRIQPRLIHPVTVTIQPLDRTNTTRDSRAREPVFVQRKLTTVTIKAQVQWGRQGRREPTAAGPVDAYDGYLIFRRKDLTAEGYTPQAGDQIVSIEDDIAQHLYLTGSIEQRGQYSGQSTLTRAPFVDRGASRA